MQFDTLFNGYWYVGRGLSLDIALMLGLDTLQTHTFTLLWYAEIIEIEYYVIVLATLYAMFHIFVAGIVATLSTRP